MSFEFEIVEESKRKIFSVMCVQQTHIMSRKDSSVALE